MGKEDKPDVLALLQAAKALEWEDQERLTELLLEDRVRVAAAETILKDSHKLPGRGQTTEASETLRHTASRLNAIFLAALTDARSLTPAAEQEAVSAVILQAIQIPCQIQEGPLKGRPVLVQGFSPDAVRSAVEVALQTAAQDSVRAREFCTELLESQGYQFSDRYISELVKCTPPKPVPGLMRASPASEGSFWN